MVAFLISAAGFIGEYFTNMSLIIFGGVVVRGLLGDGTKENEIRCAIAAMLFFLFAGASFTAIMFWKGGIL